jgi:2-phosphoglycerate kinase
MTAFNPYYAVGLTKKSDITSRKRHTMAKRHAARYWLKVTTNRTLMDVAAFEAELYGTNMTDHATIINSIKVASQDSLAKQFVHDIDQAFMRDEARGRFAVIV